MSLGCRGIIVALFPFYCASAALNPRGPASAFAASPSFSLPKMALPARIMGQRSSVSSLLAMMKEKQYVLPRLSSNQQPMSSLAGGFPARAAPRASFPGPLSPGFLLGGVRPRGLSQMSGGGWGGTSAGRNNRGGGGGGGGGGGDDGRKRSWSDFDDNGGERGGERGGESRGSRGARGGGGRGGSRFEGGRGGGESRGWRGENRGGRGGGGRFDGGRGGRVGQERPETKEELWQRQRERQAVQAERVSWLQEQNERFPDSAYIFGVSPVLAALRMKRRVMYTLFIQETMELDKRKDRGAVEEIEALAKEIGCEIEYRDKGRLNVMSGDRPHQGLVLQCSRLDFVNIKEMPAVTVKEGEKPPVWLVLDEVMDPQNLGALLRSAYFLGCGGVVVCSKNSAGLSAAVSKASAGAMEELPVHSATQLMKFLQASKDNGWKVIGAALAEDSVLASRVTLDGPTLLVMGNEGTGLRTLVLRLCDTIVQIEGGDAQRVKQNEQQGVGGEGGEVLDSLNVSVAGGILLHRLLFASSK